jgi:DNA-binding PadR family transcriptional regulator
MGSRKSTSTGPAEELVPLKPAAFHILLVLSEGVWHGYGIKQEVERLTDGVIRLGPGTLYETIQRLESEGLIAESPEGPADARDHSQRRYYEITDLGREVLCAELGRLGSVLDYARERKLVEGS